MSFKFWLFSRLSFKLKVGHLRFPINPIYEVEGFSLLIPMLCVDIVRIPLRVEDRLRTDELENGINIQNKP